MSDIDLDELRSELDDYAKPEKASSRTPREERIIAGFEEIQRFVEEHGHPPRHGDDKDIFERLCAVRLDRIRSQEDCRSLVEPLDHQGLLAGGSMAAHETEIDDDELMAELAELGGASEITELRQAQVSLDGKAVELFALIHQLAE
jgi:hypothetical protein